MIPGTEENIRPWDIRATDEDRIVFEGGGYVLFKNVIKDSTLRAAQAAYQRILRKAESGAYPYCRIYDDLLRTNIAGIEHIFHPDIYEPDLFAAVVESRLLQRTQSLLQTEAPVMLLNRIHCTTRYSHTGMWHRDADPGTEPHLQVALFLYDEDRFIVVPASHRRPNTEEELALLRASTKAILPGQAAIGGKAGDLMIFKPAILHRGSCIRERAHVHFRFGKDPAEGAIQPHRKEWFRRDEVLAQCDGAWRTMFEQTLHDGADNLESACVPARGNPVRFLKRAVGTALHHMLFFLPESHSFFERNKWITPNLRLRRMLGLS